jgi:flagellar FliJ protein
VVPTLQLSGRLIAIPSRYGTREESKFRMETQESSIRTNRLAAEHVLRKSSVAGLLIRELSLCAARLSAEIAAEEQRVGISDPKHFAYSCYAKSLIQRRDNLLHSVEDLKRQRYS